MRVKTDEISCAWTNRFGRKCLPYLGVRVPPRRPDINNTFYVGPFGADLGRQTQAVHFRWQINPDAPVEIQWRFKTDIGSLEEIGLSRA
jgi:hypothetical protein